MLRYVTLAAAFLLCVPAFAEDIFRATPIDAEQDSRLDKIEFQLERLVDQIADAQDCNEQRIAGLEADAKAAMANPVQVVALKPIAKAKPTLVSARYSTAELRSQIQQARPNGWQGPVFADVSPRSAAKRHLIGGEHGFSAEQINGLSQEETLILHDLAPGHGSKIYPMRSRSTVVAAVVARAAIVAPQRTVERTVQRSSGCANGQCAKSQMTGRSVQRSNRFRLFR